MNHLPGPAQQPHAPQAGQPTRHDTVRERAEQIAAAVDDVFDQEWKPYHRDTSQIPAIGPTPPVPQPGRAAMSQSAVDYSARVLSTGVASVLFSAAGSGLLIASNHANPTNLGLVIAAPAILVIPILALKGLMKSAKQVAEATQPDTHNHYSGHVYQDRRQTHVNTKTVGVVAVTRNHTPELPPAH